MIAFVHDAARLIREGHTVIDTHRQLWVFLLEDAAELDEVCTTTKMRCLSEVAAGEDVAGAQVYEVGARGELASHFDHVVVGSS